MSAHELKLGLRIIPYKTGLLISKRKRLDRLRAHLFGDSYARGFAFRVDKGHPNDELFFTSEELRGVLEKNPDWHGRLIGHIDYEIAPRADRKTRRFNREHPKHAIPAKSLYTLQYYPFMFPEAGSAKLDVYYDMTHKGIAIGLEERTMRLMAKKFPNYKFTPWGQNTDARQDQLKKWGVDKDWYSPAEYANHLATVLAGWNRAPREKRSPKKGALKKL